MHRAIPAFTAYLSIKMISIITLFAINVEYICADYSNGSFVLYLQNKTSSQCVSLILNHNIA